MSDDRAVDSSESSLLAHLEALRRVLLRILAGTAILYPFAYLAAPRLIRLMVGWSFPDGGGALYYFEPMEVFLIQLKLAFAVSLAAAFPWNMAQIWGFLVPALYPGERRALGWWIVFSSILFFAGVVFCALFVLPLLMRFSMSFSSASVRPMLGLGAFLGLAGWLSLSFGVVFQAPLAVMLAVRFHVVRAATLARSRPYVMVAILVIAAILTPPDVVSQLLLAVPTWLLFEVGLFFATRIERNNTP
ncbi:MAG: twin-arginine translocase subunit TatC [Kiritimatiellia bacterium]|jgi:sec-independent protein translocase protein TatC